MSSITAGTTSTTTLVHSGDTTGSLVFKTNDTGSGGTTAVTIDTSQRVGIGVTSPAKPLSVYGADGYIQMLNASTGTANGDGAFIGVEGGTTALRIVNQENDLMSFHTNGLANERMRIDSSGNLWVRTTGSTETWNATTGTFAKIGDATYPIGTTAPGLNVILNRNTSTGQIQEFKYNATAVGNISVTGSATAYNTSSDYRLKENIIPMTGALGKVAQLKPVTYKWKVDGSDGEGFIAHELAEVCPQAVEGTKDAVDENGKPIHQSIDTSFLVATLTAALQETKALIDQQAEELSRQAATINAQSEAIASLTARVVALEGK